MKAKDLRRLQRDAELERKQYGLPVPDLKKLLAIESIRKAVLQAGKAGNDPNREEVKKY